MLLCTTYVYICGYPCVKNIKCKTLYIGFIKFRFFFFFRRRNKILSHISVNLTRLQLLFLSPNVVGDIRMEKTINERVVENIVFGVVL